MAVRVRLAELLLNRRMSLAELADRVGIPPGDLQLLRDGRARAVRLSTLDALCRELACEPGDLFERGFDVEPDQA